MPTGQETYEVKTSDGKIYHVAGPKNQAHDIAAWLEQRVAAGDPNLAQDVPLPYNAQVRHHRAIPGVRYNAQNEVDRSNQTLDAVSRGVDRGFLSNFSDEVQARLDALALPDPYAVLSKLFKGTPLPKDNPGHESMWSPGSTYSSAVAHNEDYQRQVDAADASQHPIASALGNVGGVVAQTLLGGKLLGAGAGALAESGLVPGRVIPAVGAATLAAKAHPYVAGALATGAAGAAQGAVAGYGAGDTPETRAQNARVGGTLGGVMGMVAGPVVTGLAPAITRYAGALFGRLPKDEAMRQLVTALHSDGYDVASPTGVMSLKNELSSYLGKPVSLADIGTATRARAGVALRTPSELQSQSVDTVLARQAGQAQRLAGDIRATVAPRTDVHALDQALIKQRAEAALPLRDQALFENGPGYGDPARPIQPMAQQVGIDASPEDAGLRRTLGLPTEATYDALPQVFKGGVDVSGNAVAAPVADTLPAQAGGQQAHIPDDPMLQHLARLPLAQRAKEQALALAEHERALAATTGQSIDHLPDMVKPGANLDMRTFDYMKRFLDSEISTLARGASTDTFKAAEYQQVKTLRDALRQRMRDVVPAYGEYLDAYSGTSAMKDALHAGRGPVAGEPATTPGFNKLDPERIAADQAGRSTAAQELYRVGAARNMLDRVDSAAGTATQPANKLMVGQEPARLAAAGVAPADVAQLDKAVGIEKQFSKLTSELGGQGIDRQAAVAASDNGLKLPNVMNPAHSGNILFAALRALGRKASLSRNASVNEAMLPMLLERNPKAIDNIVNDLEAHGQKLLAAKLRRTAASFKTANVLGNLVGSSAATRDSGF